MNLLRPIEVRGVSVHNLKNVDLALPCGSLIAFCGRSGSGKTSLALDTLHAESQRRYLETLSTAGKRVFELPEKPNARSLNGIPASIAVTARPTHPLDGTIGTLTDIEEYLALIFTTFGTVVCPNCGETVTSDTPQSVWTELISQENGNTTVLIGFPQETEAAMFGESCSDWGLAGFVRGLSGGKIFRLESPPRVPQSVKRVQFEEPLDFLPQRHREHRENDSLCELCVSVVDKNNDAAVLLESPLNLTAKSVVSWHVIVDRVTVVEENRDRIVESIGTAFRQSGSVVIFSLSEDGKAPSQDSPSKVFSNRLACNRCGIVCVPLRPQMFRKRLPQSLVSRFGGKKYSDCLEMQVDELAEFLAKSVNRPLPCSNETTNPALDHPPTYASGSPNSMFASIQKKLGYLIQVGLGHLSLNRSLDTLSNGELRRVELTGIFSTTLVNILAILDEPSMGLHPTNIPPLLNALISLRDRGNTVIVIEHNETILEAADEVVVFGPGAGNDGGNIVFQGKFADWRKKEHQEDVSATSVPSCEIILSQSHKEHGGDFNNSHHGKYIEILGVTGRNLSNVDAVFPLGGLCVVTGPSGAGKSSLVCDTLVPAVEMKLFGKVKTRQSNYGGLTPPARRVARLNNPAPTAIFCENGLNFSAINISGRLDDIVFVDSSPIGKSVRSNPATYLKLWDEIRTIFAETTDAVIHQFGKGHFSFNVDGGRCPTCKGDGCLEMDLQILANMTIPCPDCNGKRFTPKILEVRYRTKNVADVLEMTISEAFRFFRGKSKIQQKLKRLMDVGLGYLPLGQPTQTLSGGESQRLKLAAHLAGTTKGATLFVLEEPTAGLHPYDVTELLTCFDALIATGNSFVIVDHNPQMVRAANFVIEMKNGRII